MATNRWIPIILVAILLMTSGCSAVPTATPVPKRVGESLPPTSEPASQDPVELDAIVDQVDILLKESYPVQVDLVISGHLPDSCSELERITQELDGDRIIVRVVAARPADAVCTQALEPFETTYPLDLSELEPGTYIVDVNGVETELVWEGAMVGPQVGEYIYGDALVDTFQVQIMESMPVQIALVIEGNFRDGCTELSEITQEVRGDRIVIQVRTQRPKDAMCTQALVPFSERYRLDLTDIEPGTYTLEVNGITETLELDAAMLGR